LSLQPGEQVFGFSPTTTGPADRVSTLGYEQRLDHILDTATVLIARDGYTKASMRSVAAAADISLAGLYHYFESKEKMLFLIQFRSFSSLLRRLQERLHGVEDPQDRLRVAVLAHVMQYSENKPALRVCAHEVEALTGKAHEEVQQLRHQIYSILRSIVDRILEECEATGALNAHVATMSLFGALNWLYQWYDPREDRSPAGLAQLMSDQFLGGLLGTSSSPARSSQHNGTPQ
jgi:AcrR family transcriptional regulator